MNFHHVREHHPTKPPQPLDVRRCHSSDKNHENLNLSDAISHLPIIVNNPERAGQPHEQYLSYTSPRSARHKA
jgi:hypothetical protein